MNNKMLRGIVLVFLSCILFFPGYSNNDTGKDKDIEHRFLQTLQILEDPDNAYSPDSFKDSVLSNKFHPVQAKENLGSTSSTFWYRFKIPSNISFPTLLELDNPTIEEVTLFEPTADGKYLAKKSGSNIPFDERAMQTRNITFQLNPSQSHNQKFYYLSVKSSFPLQIPLQLIKKDEYQEKEIEIQSLFMIYFSVIAFIIVINIIYFITLRNTMHLFYCGFALTVLSGVGLMSGIFYKYVWFELPEFNLYAVPALILLSVYCLHGFVRRLLRSSKYAPKHDRITYVVQIAALILLCIPVFRILNVKVTNDIALVIDILSMITLTWMAVIILRKGYKPASYYFIGFIGLALGVLFVILDFVGVLENNIGYFSLCIGSTWEMIFFMVGMIVRQKLILQENLEATEKIKAYEQKITTLQSAPIKTSYQPVILPDHIQPLSEREKEVLRLIATGMTDKEIAHKLFISLTTVKSHARKIYTKLMVSNRTEAVAVAKSFNIIPLTDS